MAKGASQRAADERARLTGAAKRIRRADKYHWVLCEGDGNESSKHRVALETILNI
jgi:hypothetical protein